MNTATRRLGRIHASMADDQHAAACLGSMRSMIDGDIRPEGETAALRARSALLSAYERTRLVRALDALLDAHRQALVVGRLLPSLFRGVYRSEDVLLALVRARAASEELRRAVGWIGHAVKSDEAERLGLVVIAAGGPAVCSRLTRDVHERYAAQVARVEKLGPVLLANIRLADEDEAPLTAPEVEAVLASSLVPVARRSATAAKE